jgi:endo-1,4-beta-xylanase
MTSRKLLIAALSATLLAAGPVWKFVTPVLDPGKPGSFDETAVKDPTIVRDRGQWHIFYTARGRNQYSLGYVASSSLEAMNAAPRRELQQLSRETNYAAAPEVFYFRPQKRWYLIYQTTASNYQPVYSVTRTIGQPESWTPPRPLAAKNEKDKWIDFWVICDARTAWLFYTRNQTDVYAMTTRIEDFPNGFASPRLIFPGVHEAVHIYKEAGASRFAMLFEINQAGWRHYGLARSPALAGPWTIEDRNFAARLDANWSRDISHGELLRTGADESLEADLAHPQFLIQGLPPAARQGDYSSLPWRLGLIRNH